MKKCIVIGDYCDDTLVCQELRSAIGGFLKDPTNMQVSFVDSYPSTIHTGYLLNQVIQTEERYGIPHETVFFVNTDPRIEDTTGVEESEGAKGIIIKLSSGIWITGPNAGYCFSFIKEKIDAAYTYSGLEKGSQFRSRDRYPRVIAHLMDYMDNELDLEKVPAKVIPDLGGDFVGHIDNYGNLKTTITKEDFKGKHEFGDTVDITINGTTHKARYVNNLFGGNVGELVIYPGSSGKPDNPFLEVSAWSHFGDSKGEQAGTGKDFFQGVKPGMKIESN